MKLEIPIHKRCVKIVNSSQTSPTASVSILLSLNQWDFSVLECCKIRTRPLQKRMQSLFLPPFPRVPPGSLARSSLAELVPEISLPGPLTEKGLLAVYLRMFALIVSVHPYCAHKFMSQWCHVITHSLSIHKEEDL